MATIQRRVLTRGARVQEWTDRLTLSCPSSCPVAPVLRRSVTVLAGVRLAWQALGSAVSVSRAQGRRACCQPEEAARTPRAP